MHKSRVKKNTKTFLLLLFLYLMLLTFRTWYHIVNELEEDSHYAGFFLLLLLLLNATAIR